MSFISNAFSGGQQSDAMIHALDTLSMVRTPKVKDLQYQVQQLVLQGRLSPEQAQAFLQDPSAMGSLDLDPSTRNAQMASMGDLQEIVDAGGLSAVDRSKLSQARSEVAQHERGDREAILANAQARGVGGSNLTLQSMLLGQQGAATRESQAGLDTAAQAYQNRLQAIKDVANLGGQVRATDFGQASTIAQAKDAIAQFNAAQKQAVEQTNVGTRNLAQEKNLAEQQRIADSNIAIRNQKAQADAMAIQQDYNNRIAKAGQQAQVFMKQSDMYGQMGQQGMQMVGGMANPIAGIIKSDEREKTDVEPFDSSSFLDALVPARFKYKHPTDPGSAPGPQVGVMAQDVEKVLPQAVEEDPQGVKYLKPNEMVSPILAALTDVNSRLKLLEGK